MNVYLHGYILEFHKLQGKGDRVWTSECERERDGMKHEREEPEERGEKKSEDINFKFM